MLSVFIILFTNRFITEALKEIVNLCKMRQRNEPSRFVFITASFNFFPALNVGALFTASLIFSPI